MSNIERIQTGNRSYLVVWPMNWSIPTSAYVRFTRNNKRLKGWDEEGDETETISWAAYRMFTIPAKDAHAQIDDKTKIILGSASFPTGVREFEGLGSLFGAESDE